MDKHFVEPGSVEAPDKYRIQVTNKGPYLVWGRPPVHQQFITPDENGEMWWFTEGHSYPADDEPTAYCRCGASKRKPYCDGSHARAEWSPELTAPETPLLDGADVINGPRISLSDNQRYCVFARFCDAKGRAWNLAEQDSESAARAVVHEAEHCPNSRLSAWRPGSDTPEEHIFEPSLGLIEDPETESSGGLWVRGGIPVSREDGFTYEVRNRAVLCRCGRSDNKPYCDGTHAALHWRDGLSEIPGTKKW